MTQINPTPGFNRSLAKNRDVRSLIQGWLRSDTVNKRAELISRLPHGYKTKVYNLFANVRTLLTKAEEAIEDRDRTIDLVKRVAHFVIHEKQLEDEMMLAQHLCEQGQMSSCRIVYDMKETRPKAITRPIEAHQIHICYWMVCKGEGYQLEADNQCDELINQMTDEYSKGLTRFIIKPL